MRNQASALFCFGLIASHVSLSPASAQTVGNGPLPEMTADAGDIVVTAQRRAQTLNDVPLSINVISGNDLTERGLTTASDLAKVVPGFTASDSSFGIPVYTIRGIGFNDYSLASNSTVAVYIDEVPLPYPAMTQGAVLDLERIEVLKGPQGTLYGANSTGGAINYIAQKPTDELHAGVNLGYSRFDTFDADAFISGSITPTLKARLSGSTTQGGPWQYSTTRPGDQLGSVHRGAGRLVLDWEPTSNLTVEIDGNGWIDNSDTQALQLVSFQPSNPGRVPLLPQVFNAPISPNNARAADWDPNPTFPLGAQYPRDDWFYQFSGKIKWQLADHVSLTSITAYSRFHQNAFYDRDGVAAVNNEYTVLGNIDSIYQELRLAGDLRRLTWSIGANYRHDKIKDFEQSDVQASTTTYFAYDYAYLFSNETVNTFAVFGDAEYKILPQLSIVGGVRYTEDKRDDVTCLEDSGSGKFAAFASRIANGLRAAKGLPPITLQPGQCGVIDASLNAGSPVYGTLDQDNVSWHGGINYKPNSDTLFYFNAARGYKAGAFGTVGGILATQFAPIVQERVDALEGGFKVSLFDRLLQLNGAGFRYNYINKQLRGRILDPVFGSVSKLVNVPRSRIIGGELEAVLHPARRFTLNVSAVYLDATIEQFVGVNLANQVQDFAGQALNFTPKWSVNAGADYEFPLSSTMTGRIGGDLAYRSSTSAFFGNVPGQEINGYTTLDLRAGVRRGGWNLTVFGRNVTNAYYWNNVIKGTDTLARVAARPVTYGFTAGYRF